MSSVTPTAAATGVGASGAGAGAPPASSPGAYKGVAITAGDDASIQAQIAAIDAKTPPTPSSQGAGPSSTKGSVPPAAVPQMPTGPITTSQFDSATKAPNPTDYASATGTPTLTETAAQVASLGLTSSQKTIDDLQAERQRQTDAELASEQNSRDSIEGKLNDITSSTPNMDALTAARAKFNTDQTIQQYQDIQQKIVQAQEALQMGIVYEGSQPARESLIQGRTATLKEQGLATIGALQGVAAVLKGNIDLGTAYANATIDAIDKDRADSIAALNTLLALHNSNIVTLTATEKGIVDDRIKAYQSQSDQLQKNKDDVATLMTTYPKAFLAGGVTLTDTKEQALAKMLPTMAADERAKFNAQMQASYDAHKTATTAAAEKTYTTQMLNFKAKGMTYADAVNGFADKIPIASINAIYGETAGAQATTQSDLYQNFVNPDGTPKPGYQVGLDAKGQPIVQKAGSSQPNFLSNLWNGVTGAFSG